LSSEEAQIMYAMLNELAPLFGTPQTRKTNSLGGTAA
jgi:hypothetical protein